MGTLIVGANGATGRLLVEELLKRGQTVKIVVRSLDSLHSDAHLARVGFTCYWELTEDFISFKFQ